MSASVLTVLLPLAVSLLLLPEAASSMALLEVVEAAAEAADPFFGVFSFLALGLNSVMTTVTSLTVTL